MKTTPIYILLALSLVVFTSGCVGGGENQVYSMTDGAVIRDFSFDVNQIYDDEPVTLSLTIENVGAKKIPGNTVVYIYHQPLTDSEDKRGKQWYVSNSGGFKVNDEEDYMTLSLKNDEFLPPSSEMNIPGTSRVFYIDLEPPNIPDGMSNSYPFIARLCYPYYTTALAKIIVVSENELRYEGPPKTDAVTRNSAGPIHISMVGSPTLRPSANQLPLVFKVKNVGGGFPTLQSYPCTVDPELRQRDKVMVNVTVDGSPADCGDGIVRLRNGEGEIRCIYRFPAGAPSTEHDVTATVTYNYYVTAMTEIEVMDSISDSDY